MAVSAAERPAIRLLPGAHTRIAHGHPWVFSNEVTMTPEAKRIERGAVVRIVGDDGRDFGAAFFNPHSLICARLLAAGGGEEIGRPFIEERLKKALALRQALYAEPYYRLVHAEADGLPGLIVDRLGEVVVCQLNSAGIDRLAEPLLAALTDILDARTVVLRNDTGARELEGLTREVRCEGVPLTGPVVVRENGGEFLAAPSSGQKTGWFFDQRDNRAFVAQLCRGRRVLDLYSYLGGFAIQAARAGAASVRAVDRSEEALALAREAAERNGISDRTEFVLGSVFDYLEEPAHRSERFDVVICDPPAFVKSRKALASGVKGYRKLAGLAAPLVAEGGFLFVASCSQAVEPERFERESAIGLGKAGRRARLIRSAGAGPDHPIHPHLPQSAYLKARVYALD
jgi:23S rRNA (cytosine1962-C5)-methyltransferase